MALDGSPESQAAQDAAVALAQATGACLRLITVLAVEATAFGWGYGVIDLEDKMREVYQQRLHEAAARVPEGIEVRTELRSRGAVPTQLERSAEQLDLLFLGSRGYGPIRRVLLGSVSAPLVKHCPCPVLVVPRGARPEHDDDAAAGIAEQAR